MRILAFSLSALILLLAAALIGPSFMDWNKYKTEIMTQVKASSGYDVQINGDLSLAILPSPRVTFKDAVIRSPNPVKEQTLIKVEEATVSVALFPLLQKRVQVESVKLVKPDIRLEVNQEGRQSWMVVKAAETVDVVSEVAESTVESTQNTDALKSISLDSVKIEDGRIQYVDYQKNSSQIVEHVNLDLSAGSIYGPYNAKGDMAYGENKIVYETKVSEIKQDSNDIEINAKIGLPDKNAQVTFDGVAGRVAPYNAQGEIKVTLDKLQDLASVPDALAGKTSLRGMLSANESQASIRDADFEIGKLKGKGAVDIAGIKEKNPLSVTGKFDLESGLNVDDLMTTSGKKDDAKGEGKGGAAKTAAASSPVPQTLTLPFPLTADIAFNAPELVMNGQSLKGVTVTLAKQGPALAVQLAAQEIPGKGNLDAVGKLTYASSSNNAGGGVTYADPSLSFAAKGNTQQLPTLLRAVAPDQKDNPAFEAFKTAQFDVTGGLAGETITLNNTSRLTLDDTALALGGFYKPAKGEGKPEVGIDLAANYLNIDDLKARLTGQKPQAVQPAATGEKTDVKKALEPVREFSLPVNLTFDINLQKARFNGMDASGIRLKGKSAGEQLVLENAAAESLMGASVSAKGQVANLKNLSGINLTVAGKTSDVKALMTSLKMDTSKLPAQLSAAEAAVDAKGTADALNFNANVKALSGSLDAAGTATNLLDKAVFSNLTLRAKHPNFVQAMQIANPEFTGGPGLAKPIDFYAKLINEGKVYTLNDFKASLGQTTASGNLKYDGSGAKPSVGGNLVLGDVPLDSLLDNQKGGSSSGGSGGSSGTAAPRSGERWSSNAFNMGWMHSANMDLNVSAKSITYGGWNFQNPKTNVTLSNGSLKVQDLTAGLFGGSAKLNASAQSSADQKQPVTLSVDSTMDKVNMEQLAAALSSSRRIQASGVGSLSFNVAGSGISPNAMVNSLKGKANLDANNVVFKGFDLAQLAGALLDSGKPLDRLQGIVGGATTSGQTQFDTIDGDYTISEGIVTISSMAMKGPAATIVSTGNVSLPRWYIDTLHTITLANAKELEPFKVEIKGPLDNPANTFGSGLFQEILNRRVKDKVQEKLQDKLPDLLGKDTTEKLQQFGIIPQKAAPAPAPTPTPDATPVDENVAPEAAPAPAQEAPKEQKPEDVLKDVLGGFLKQ